MLQLLWIETLLKLACGLVLTFVPLTAARIFGLPRPDTGFWPRMLGAVLIGLAGATFLDGWIKNAQGHGLGLGGCIIINLMMVSMLITLLVLDRAGNTRRGRALLWIVVALLVVISMFEISQI